MARMLSVDDSSLSAKTLPMVTANPITGVFGKGKVQLITKSGQFIVPEGVDAVRVRQWGADAYEDGGSGGFALKVITGLVAGDVIDVSVGQGGVSTAVDGGTTSFGNYFSATGGLTDGTPGEGIGGDINNTGGSGEGSGGGGGCAGIFGDGGDGSASKSGGNGNSGGGAGSATNGSNGGNGITGRGGAGENAGENGDPGEVTCLDYIGTGGGGGRDNAWGNGANGGGGAVNGRGAMPGGAGGTNSEGADGLVAVEY